MAPSTASRPQQPEQPSLLPTPGSARGHRDSRGLARAALRRQPPSLDLEATCGLGSSGCVASPSVLNPVIRRQLYGCATCRQQRPCPLPPVIAPRLLPLITERLQPHTWCLPAASPALRAPLQPLKQHTMESFLGTPQEGGSEHLHAPQGTAKPGCPAAAGERSITLILGAPSQGHAIAAAHTWAATSPQKSSTNWAGGALSLLK